MIDERPVSVLDTKRLQSKSVEAFDILHFYNLSR